MWWVGSISDQRSPPTLPRNLCAVFADARSAVALSATSLGGPLEPLVGMTTAISDSTVVNSDGPNASAGPLPSSAAEREAITCVIDHAAGTSSNSRGDLLTIAPVGYRLGRIYWNLNFGVYKE